MEITSVNNKLIKNVKTLYRKRDRMDKGLFIVEGMKMVEEALDMDYPLENIFFMDNLLDIRNGERLYNRIIDLDKSIEVSEEVFREISDTETPQGVIAIAKLTLRNIQDIKIDEDSRYILLDGLQDPGNMGTIIRSADAFNIDGIIIKSGTVDPYNPKVVRASMGSIFRIPIYYLNDMEEILKLKNKGLRILSTSLEESKNIKYMDFNKSIIVIGNESQGVSEKIFDLSDDFIKISMPGSSESLNAGVAASIIMYESMK